jgi:hypothetical protein
LELIPTNSGSNTKKYKEMNRRISINTIGLAVPQSFITKSKQRLKQQIDTVYLNDGDEFEIELYNPTQNKVLAKIEMNGNSIGNGIILRPGERIFLERYLDEAKKFLFETYVVNGNNDEVKQAIANNGDVVIKFYDEVRTSTYNVNSGTVTINNPNLGWGLTTGSPYYGNATFTTSGTNMIYNSTLTSGNYERMYRNVHFVMSGSNQSSAKRDSRVCRLMLGPFYRSARSGSTHGALGSGLSCLFLP